MAGFSLSAARMQRARIAPLALAIGLSSVAAPLVQAADADAPLTQHYQVPAGDLAGALTGFARQAGVSVQFDAAQLANLRAPQLAGEYSVAAGFAQLLSGTGLQAVEQGQGVYIVVPADSATDSTMLGVLLVTGERVAAAPTSPVGGVVARSSLSATKTGTDLLATPQAVNVVTREEIEARGAGDLAQALQYTPGVVSQYGNTDMRHDWFMVRGFNPGRFMDGLRLPYGVLGYAQPRIDPFLLERVEVLKGPGSVLYGQSTPGGLLNMVSKRPTERAQGEVHVEYGSHEHREVGLDLGGPLDEQGRVRYRMVALLRDADSQVDHVGEERQLLAPSLSLQLGENTELTLLAHYQKIDADGGGAPPALPALGTLYGGAPWGKLGPDTFIGEPGYDQFTNEQMFLGYELEHRLNEVWTLRQNLRLARVDTDTQRVQGAALAGNDLVRYAWAFPEDSDSLTLDNQALASFRLGQADHKVLLGLDYQLERGTYDEHFDGLNVSPIDLGTLAYTGDAVKPPLTTRREQDRYQVGAYLQDEIAINGFTLHLAGRYDLADADNTTRNIVAGSKTSVDQRDEAFSGRIGLVYEFDNGLAPYVSYSESFLPTSGTDAGGNALEPTEGKQYELGLRFQPLDGNSLWTLSAYELTQQNVLTRDLLTNERSQTGEVRMRGVELEAKVELTQGLQALASYTLADSEITRDGNPGIKGNEQPFVPNKQGSLWLAYGVEQGLLRGLGLGGGARYIGESYGETANLYETDSVTLFDASVSYDVAKAMGSDNGVTLQLSANNLTDREYISTCISALGCYWGEGRSVTGSVTYNW